MAINDLGSWNFKTAHTQPGQLGNTADGGNYVSSESIVICAVTPNTEPIGTSDLFPIGILQNASIQQQKQINQLFEIGSRLPFFIPGRTMIQIQLTRVVFNGDSLMAVLYHPNGAANADVTAATISPGPETAAGTGGAEARRFYINLASEVFNKGMDIALVIVDSEDQVTGCVVFRECLIQAHGLGISSNQTVIAENVSLRARDIENMASSVVASARY